jgi:hypothetical protein
MTDNETRVLSLALPETQWRALLEIEPEPIQWLRQQIVGRIDHPAAPQPPAAQRAADRRTS